MKRISTVLLTFLLCTFFLAAKPASAFHPYHVGSVEFRYSEATKTFQISGKFFLDDLENALKRSFGQTVHFHEAKYRQQINNYLSRYCEQHLRLKADNKALKVNYIGYEEDSESVNIYLESEILPMPQKVETAVSLLYNLFDDQMNIIHIVVGGKRHSSRLMYPDRYLYQNF
ncbi:hypothetical protein CO230_01390 [Chryseobacterium sp. 6424]|uniref:DUF6702 family protein n=1 Tax=Chryseobacterium sp. 6424 TaxID=2039166 RepID=UPI000EFD2C82|nr:DUF6702 family protein [Chryseobacterium sp. 6424]AYO56902.1 hypothetical protein CO230_01390 [Chryseobacterium sp. 6424]